MLTGQCVTRRGTSALWEEELHLLPAGDLAAVGSVEARVDALPAKRAVHLGFLGPAVDLRAGDVLRDRCERVLDAGQALAGFGGLRQRPGSAWAAQGPELRR